MIIVSFINFYNYVLRLKILIKKVASDIKNGEKNNNLLQGCCL